VQRRLDDVIRQQEELLRQVQELRDELARERGNP
jgi:hypothetical protein